MVAVLFVLWFSLMAKQDSFLFIGDSLIDIRDPPATDKSVNEAYWYDRQHYPGASDFALNVIGVADIAAKFADAWFVGTGRVAGFINAGISGQKLIGGWDSAGSDRTTAQNYYSDNGSPTIRAVLCILGANDIMSGATVSTATYVTGIQSVKTWITSTFAGSPQLYFGLISQASSAGFSGGDANSDFVSRSNRFRQAVLDAETAGHCVLGWNGTGEAYSDNVHYDTQAQRTSMAYGMYLAVNGGTPAPRITSATVNSAKTIVTVYINRAIGNSLASSVGAFRVFDNGVSVTVSTQTVTTTARIALGLASPASGTVTVSFAHVRDAVGATMPVGIAQSVNSTTYAAPLVPAFDLATTISDASGQFATVFASAVR